MTGSKDNEKPVNEERPDTPAIEINVEKTDPDQGLDIIPVDDHLQTLKPFNDDKETLQEEEKQSNNSDRSVKPEWDTSRFGRDEKADQNVNGPLEGLFLQSLNSDEEQTVHTRL